MYDFGLTLPLPVIEFYTENMSFDIYILQCDVRNVQDVRNLTLTF